MKMSNTIIKAYEGETKLLLSKIAECENVVERRYLKEKLDQVNEILSNLK